MNLHEPLRPKELYKEKFRLYSIHRAISLQAVLKTLVLAAQLK
jgi:hypothetical protein